MERCSNDGLEVYVMVRRSIWSRRNAVMHGGPFTHSCTLMNRGKGESSSISKSIGQWDGIGYF
jgi:hypothetical protein